MDTSVLVIIPIIAALLIIAFRKEGNARRISLVSGIVQLVVSFTLLLLFVSEKKSGNTAQFIFEVHRNWFPEAGITYSTGIDGISILMICLTSLVVLPATLVSWKTGERTSEFFLMIQLLAAGAYGFFISLDLVTMFFFLEMAVLPKFLLIGIWGSGKNKESAMKLALMLMGGSALLLAGLIGIYFSAGKTFDLQAISTEGIHPVSQLILFPLVFAGFGVFTAMFPFHSWAPDGHSSAPTAASMFLAGISMKLGGYGCIRVAMFLMPYAAGVYSPWIISLGVIAIVYGGFVTLMQKDLKYLNAYSSISHCGFVILGIGMMTRTSVTGAILQMVSHGLMTALFFAVIGMIYERTHTRMLDKLGGLMKAAPFISSSFLIAGLCSLGLPGLSGFAAEITVFIGSFENEDLFRRAATLIAATSIVVTAVYIIRAAGKTIFGGFSDSSYATLKDAGWHERSAALLLLAAIFLMGLAPFLFTGLLEPGVELLFTKLNAVK